MEYHTLLSIFRKTNTDIQLFANTNTLKNNKKYKKFDAKLNPIATLPYKIVLLYYKQVADR